MKPVFGCLVAMGCISILGGPAAQAQPGKSAPPVAGRPNWTGVWSFVNGPLTDKDGEYTVLASSNPDDPTSPLLTAPMPKFKGKYLDLHNARIKALRVDRRPLRDDGARCLPTGMPRFWSSALAYEIIHSPEQINVFAEYMTQTRRVHLDGRPHPAELEPTFQGHSIGRWEGDVLVVDTTGIRADSGIGVQYEGEHSAAVHIVERFIPRFSATRDEIEVQMRVEDPEAFAEPWLVTYTLVRKPSWELKEEICNENNRNPIGEDGVTQTLLKPQK